MPWAGLSRAGPVDYLQYDRLQIDRRMLIPFVILFSNIFWYCYGYLKVTDYSSRHDVENGSGCMRDHEPDG